MRALFWMGVVAVLAQPLASAAKVVVRLETTMGNIDLELFDGITPITVANFLNYVADDDYDSSFIHRSVPGFIIQGGGFAVFPAGLAFVPTDPPIVNEFNLSNVRGTVAMAKVGGDPDSADSQWFINLTNNNGELDPNGNPSVNLDAQNGGFTVFAQVIGGSMAVVDAIAALIRINLTSTHPALDTVPLTGWQPGDTLIPLEHFVIVTDVFEGDQNQCGDLDDDWLLSPLDPALLRVHLADPIGQPLTPAGALKCSVIGDPSSCDVRDAVVLRRALAGLQPTIGPVCSAAP